MVNTLEVRNLLTHWYLLLKNLCVGKLQVLAAASTACDAQAAIVESKISIYIYRYYLEKFAIFFEILSGIIGFCRAWSE